MFFTTGYWFQKSCFLSLGTHPERWSHFLEFSLLIWNKRSILLEILLLLILTKVTYSCFLTKLLTKIGNGLESWATNETKSDGMYLTETIFGQKNIHLSQQLYLFLLSSLPVILLAPGHTLLCFLFRAPCTYSKLSIIRPGCYRLLKFVKKIVLVV